MTVRQWIVIVLIAGIVGVVSFTTSSALSSRRMSGPGARACVGTGMTPVIEYLQLTSEQQDRIRPIDERFRRDQMAACTEMEDARARLLDVLKQPNTRKADLDAALDDVARAQATVQRETAEYLLEIKPVLTDDQRDRLFRVVGQKFCGQAQCGAGTCPGGGQGARRPGRPW